jgi:anti-sigma regulatory factor (Ser/Thr protein kinase)
MPEGLPAELFISLPTDLIFVRPGRKMIEGLLLAQGWEEDDVEEAILVATELIQNAIEHGSRCDGSERTVVAIAVTRESVTFDVTDPGTGKDPSGLLDRDVTEPVPLDAPRGRGLFLINRLAREFVRERCPEGGCRVRVRLETVNE